MDIILLIFSYHLQIEFIFFIQKKIFFIYRLVIDNTVLDILRCTTCVTGKGICKVFIHIFCDANTCRITIIKSSGINAVIFFKFFLYPIYIPLNLDKIKK